MGYSNQRITKIKKDPILELLQRAEATDVEDACVVISAIETLTPYPNPEQTRTWIRDNLLKGVNAIIPIKGLNPKINSHNTAGIVSDPEPYKSQAIQYTTIIDGLPLNTYSHKILGKLDDTTYNYKLGIKPGLMLSNLCCPVSFEAGGGSFLRQANSQNIEIVSGLSYNCRTFTELYNGHYAYTFLQRGIYHRVAGSTHNNNDSYMLHWSPMPNSSTTYEGMLIPGTQFRNSYTNYMTICMPVDLNMKYYSYGKSKDVEFTHVDNNTNNTISTTNYNGKIVGIDWSFEFNISGNHAGSGSNWGENPTTGPNSSNGICVNGQFVYTDVLGNPCTQLVVDWCQQTIEAQFNPNNPNINSDVAPINQSQSYNARTCSYSYPDQVGCSPIRGSIAPLPNYCVVNAPYQSGAPDYKILNFYRYIKNGGLHYIPTTSPNSFCYYSPGNCGSRQAFISYYNEEFEQQEDARFRYCSSYTTIKPTTPGLPEGRVNIYLNITDEKAVVDASGGFWNYSCGVRDRFTYELSFEPCTEIGCTAVLLYENIGVTDNGDFDTDIQEISISG